MPITEPSIPVRVLDALLASSVPFVVLHSESLLGSPKIASDVDLAVGWSVPSVIARISESLDNLGLRPAVLWPYDVGGAASVFFATPGGEEGAQVDFLYDPDGKGRYGLRSGAIIAAARPGLRYPVPDPIDAQLYLLRKRISKSQTEQAERELTELAGLAPAEVIERRAGQLFSPVAAAVLVGQMHGETLPARANNRPFQNAFRRARRLARPVGLWVELIGPEGHASELAFAIRGRFSRWLPHTGMQRRPRGNTMLVWFLQEVLPVRLRAGLFLSWADLPRRPKADLTLRLDDVDRIDRLAVAIVDAFVERSMR